jgi:hypothetical protein
MLVIKADMLERLSILAVSMDESCHIPNRTRSLVLVYLVMTRAVMTNIVLMVYSGRHRPTHAFCFFT